MLWLLTVTFFAYLFFYWLKNHTWESGAPYEATNPELIKRIISFAGVSKNDIVYDLGSGDGRIVIACAMLGAKAIGVESDWIKVFYSRFWIKILRLQDNAKIVKDDIYKHNLSQANVIIAFLLPETNDKLEDKLKKDLGKGTRVVGVGFEFKNWKPEKVSRAGNSYDPLFLYRI
jgi:ribosomal protein L11 methylase PrmA